MENKEYSDWVCYCFGAEPFQGICWRPKKGKEPNWFWRKMQFLIFGNLWIKDEKKESKPIE